MIARTGAVERFTNSAFTALASSTSLVVSTTIAPPSPSIHAELASEKPTATHTPCARSSYSSAAVVDDRARAATDHTDPSHRASQSLSDQN